VEYEKLNQVLSESPNALLGPGSAAVTIFHGGTRQNTIPGSAEVIIDRRLIPGETHADADRELERVIELVKQTIPELALESIEVIVATIPSQTDPEAFIVETALIASDHVTGITKTARGFNAGCDMSKLVTIAGIPTVIIGPGSLSQAHAPDEFVEISQVEEAVLIYEQIALRFLGR
jgi:acetylornithine deacetylase/succinyl-diaminopimelate desuccinylase-like protein